MPITHHFTFHSREEKNAHLLFYFLDFQKEGEFCVYFFNIFFFS